MQTAMQPSFTEIQRFNRWWHYLIAAMPVLLTIGIGLSVYRNLAAKFPVSAPWALLILGFIVVITLLTCFWYLYLKLETVIDARGVYVRFRGIPFCKRTIAWHEIKRMSVISYSPLSDYGGWGVRYGLAGNGWGYIVGGDKGIKLFYQNDTPFLIGTRQEQAARTVIDHYFKP